MSKTVKCISPVDGSLYAERPVLDAAEVERVIGRARAAQAEWRRTPVTERVRALSAAVDAMLAMADDIVPELAWQMGRPVRFGGGELRGFEERARHMLAIAEETLSPVTPAAKEGFRRYIRRDPLGLVFTIAPWNYPYLTTVNSVVPALAAGNAVMLKAAQQTLLVGERFARAMEAAGLPEGLFTNLCLDHQTTTGIISGGHVDHVCFTGSVEAGRAMERAAAGTFTTLGLELGGKDPAYVRADADLDHAVENLVDGSFFNSGQSCCGIERIYVDAAVHERFLEGFVELTRGYVLGNPLEQATTLGPMSRAAAADFVRGQIEEAVSGGAVAHLDPKAFARDQPGTPYLAPQVLSGVDHGMSVMREETFGPVVGIMPVASEEEAVALMNDSPYGLTASVWTKSIEAAERIGMAVETGTVFMNRCDYLDPALAWTGVKDTGHGATLSRIGYEMLTRPKSFHLRHAV